MRAIGISLLVLGLCATAERNESLACRGDRAVLQRDSQGEGQAVSQGDAKKKQETKGKLRFTISKETTYVTAPLDKDGRINYAAALNERLRKGVTPQNNANVLLWKAVGPHPVRANMPPEFFQWMGIDAPPESGEYFVAHERYIKERLKIDDPEQIMEFENQLGRAVRRPWKPEQYPGIAGWLKANEKPLAVVFEATKCSHYFSPLVPTRDKKGMSSGLVGALLPVAQTCRRLADVFSARAMLHLGAGRYDDAWQEILACHRLGRLVAHGSTMIEFLVGVAIDSVASNADLVFVASPELTSAQIKERLRDLQRLPTMPGLAEKVDLGERFEFLDIVMLIDRYGIKYLEGLSDGAGTQSKFSNLFGDLVLGMVDWDPALRNINRWYDRTVAAIGEKDRGVRDKRLEGIEEDVKALKTEVLESMNSGRFAAALSDEKNSASVLGKSIGDILISHMLPAVRKLQQHSDRIEQVHRNLHLAFALAAYRRDHGSYPRNLEALAPNYLPQIPQDLFTGKPLVYRPSENGYLLYSFGPNGRDDEGHGFDDDPRGDDESVRMPLPKLRHK